MTPSMEEFKKVLSIMEKYNMTAEKLELICLAPSLTKDNIQLFLNACSQIELAELFYTTGLVKLAEMVEQKHQTKINEQAKYAAHPGGSNEALPDKEQSK